MDQQRGVVFADVSGRGLAGRSFASCRASTGSMRKHWDFARIALFAVLGGCSLGETDFSVRRCPCAPGWVCTPLNVCVPEEETTDAALQAGLDAAQDAVSRPDSGEADASSLDSGSAVDAGTDGGVDAGRLDAGEAPYTACSDILSEAVICRDMETKPPGFSPDRGGTVELSDEPVYRGEWSLRFFQSSPTAPAFRQHRFVPSDPVTSGSAYLRGYFYFPSGQGPFNDWVFMHMQEDGSPFAFVGAVLGPEGRVGIRFSKVGPGNTTYSTMTMPFDRWVCVQFEVDIDDSAGRAAVYVDGALAHEVDGVDTLPSRGIFNSLVGIDWSGAGAAPATVYVDEFAGGQSPLPCDP